MYLMSQNDVISILNDSTLLLEQENVNDLTMLRVVVPNRVKQLAAVMITTAGSLTDSLVIAIATLDQLSAVDRRDDLLGKEQQPELGACLPCISTTDVTSSLVHNLCVAATATKGAVHTSGVNYPSVPEKGVVLVVECTITDMGYQPVVSLYISGKMVFQGDPSSLILYRD